MVRGMEHNRYEEWLGSPGFISSEKRRMQGGLMAAYNFLTKMLEEQALISLLIARGSKETACSCVRGGPGWG